MRKVVLALLLTAVGLGLLLSFKSRAASSTATALGGSALSGAAGTSKNGAAGGSSPTPSASGSAAPSASASTSAAKAGSGGKSGTFTGTAESTQYGDVQVQAVISGGKLTNVIVLQVPDRGGYENQIVQIALPELKSEALSAQSANIDVISGATYTSQGYAQSLQSALDQAGL
ncbi:MAG TPA: FMN-binding protein [Actinospica sp.]|nr:FMN-binding protein [Actinospica sp.]